ncbi:MAG: DUF4286 family protein [Bacteroidia bacterium]|nr:DUF4286 family protein [Bacteroidia bacterium]
MIIYNVTCNVSESMAAEWLNWMKEEHIPEVMATGLFSSYRILKLLTVVEDNEGLNYAIQYSCDSVEAFDKYVEIYGPGLKAKTYEKYGDSVLAFRTLLEEV